MFSQRHKKVRRDKYPSKGRKLTLICFQISILRYLAPLIPLPRGFDGNANVVGPPGYEILLRQTWCYVILHN